jgi:hypothetical protein
MGVNIGLDIGAISLKLAALGQPEDRPLLESLCAAKPSFRLLDWDAPGGRRLPLVISDYRRIAGSPIQSTFDLLQELYEAVPEKRIEGIRVTGSGSRTIARILGIYFEGRSIRKSGRSSRSAGRVRNTSASSPRPTALIPASWITTGAASAPPEPARFWISRPCE